MAIAPLPRRHVPAQVSVRLQRAVAGALFALIVAAAITAALMLGPRVWHALLELGLLAGLGFLVRLIVTNAIAIFRDEP